MTPRRPAWSNLDGLLRLFRATGPVINPYVNGPAAAPLGRAFAAYARATADLVDACRVHHPDGYAGALEAIEALTGALPPVPDSDPVLVEHAARLVRTLAEAPTHEETP